MTRRAWILAVAASTLVPSAQADSADDAWDVIASAARELSEATALPPPNRGTAVPFLSYFDKGMNGYDTLSRNATALIDQADLQSTLDLVSNEGDDGARSVEVDWTLRLADPATSIQTSQRRQNVKCRVKKQGRKWKIVSLDPIAFFAPPRA